jgi:hypothetical protein
MTPPARTIREASEQDGLVAAGLCAGNARSLADLGVGDKPAI